MFSAAAWNVLWATLLIPLFLLATADTGKTNGMSAASAPPQATAISTAPAATAPPVSPAIKPDAHSNATLQANHAPAVPAIPASPAFLVVIDPAHGGSDSGARITPTMAEKDITLSLARRLRSELQSRHIAVDLLRDGDTDLSFDDRAARTNLERPALFISLHAEPGRAVNIYTPALPVALSAKLDKRSLLPWRTAQMAFLKQSAALAPDIAQSIGKREIRAQVRAAFLEPMHLIAAPAVAVEAPATGRGLRIPEEQIAGAIAEAIEIWKAGGGTVQ